MVCEGTKGGEITAQIRSRFIVSAMAIIPPSFSLPGMLARGRVAERGLSEFPLTERAPFAFPVGEKSSTH